MNKFTKVSLFILSTVLILSGCQKKDWDEYYGRPSTLAPPIYQQLQTRGNFTSLLALIEKAGYKTILGQSGSWTLFAANDAAFQKYFTDNNTSLDKIDVATAQKLALYGLVYNPFRKDQLTFNQTSLGLIPDVAYRRQTAYYDFVYTDPSGKKVVDNGLNGVLYAETINNNKYIPYFINSYFTFNGLTAAGDFTPFYPGQTMSGFDVAGAKVINADIAAENGIIHEVDKVLEPLPNVDQYLSSRPEYSEFKKLLDKLSLLTPNVALTKRYNVLTGATDQVYLKTYDAGLAFSPNNENFLNVSTDAQVSSWSIAVPTNQELKKYTDDILQYYGGSFDNAPPSILLNFLNSHMWRSTVWPSRITQDPNFQVEPVTFAKPNVIESKLLSNANFYGINKVQEANVFRTIYGHAYLNPAYALMTLNINQTDLRAAVLTPTQKYTMFLMSDAALNAAGYVYNFDLPGWGYSTPGIAPVFDIAATNRVARLVQTSVLITPNGEFDNLAGEGVAEAFNGEYVKFKAGRVQASGNVADKSFVTVTASKTSVNGRVYYTNGILKFAEDAVTIPASLQALATDADVNVRNQFSHFNSYLRNSTVYDAVKNTVQGVLLGSFNTVYVPTNAAIEIAVKAGRLPGNTTTGIPSFTSGTWTAAQKTAVANFILYSILDKVTVAVDGKKPGQYPTLLKNTAGDSRLLTVRYPAGSNPNPASMELLDDAATVTTANVPYSNNVGNRVLIHSINTVLKF